MKYLLKVTEAELGCELRYAGLTPMSVISITWCGHGCYRASVKGKTLGLMYCLDTYHQALHTAGTQTVLAAWNKR